MPTPEVKLSSLQDAILPQSSFIVRLPDAPLDHRCVVLTELDEIEGTFAIPQTWQQDTVFQYIHQLTVADSVECKPQN